VTRHIRRRHHESKVAVGPVIAVLLRARRDAGTISSPEHQLTLSVLFAFPGLLFLLFAVGEGIVILPIVS
jgi:hypothetical protein